jgi:hypothetical protein
MCRNIRPLYHFEPPVTDDEVRAASLQFVRKVSGFTRPSAANQPAFDQAVTEVSEVVHRLLDSLVTNAPPKNREAEAAKARARASKRYGAPAPTAEAALGVGLSHPERSEGGMPESMPPSLRSG